MSELLTCPSCGAEMPAELDPSFCFQCGETLEGTPEPAVSDLLSEERRVVTILFADLVGFTAFSQTRDPEEVERIANELFDRFATIIGEAGGTVDKVMGDAIMAVFGAPAAHEDDPVRAVSAALSMQEEITSFNARFDADDQLTLRIGINTGEVIWGEMPDGEKTVLGDEVNRARRLEEAAEPGRIWVSETTRDRTGEWFRFEKQPTFSPKGLEGTVQPFEVRDERTEPEQLQDVGGIQSRMVDRDEEFDQLIEQIEESNRDSRPTYTILTGPVGVGKSRLMYELQDHFEGEEEVSVWKGQCRATRHRPFGPLREIIRQRAEIGRGDNPEAAREKLNGMLRSDFQEIEAGAAEVRNWVHLIGDAVGVEFPAEQKEVDHLDPSEQRSELFVGIRMWIRSLAGSGTVVWIFEDVHQMDDSTRAFLSDLLSVSGEPTFSLFLTARGDELDEQSRSLLFGDENIDQIRLEPLGSETIDEVVRSALGAPAEAKLVALLEERAAGNPYFIEELLRYLLERDLLKPSRVGEDFRYVLAEPERAMEEVPEKTRSVLVARIDRLEETPRTVTKTASVMGRSFWEEVVRELVGVRITEPLEVLTDREIVFEQGGSPVGAGAEYIFKNRMLRDVAYEQLLNRQKETLHGQVAEWLKENVAEPGHEIEALRARNLRRAGKKKAAAEAYRRAGRMVRETPASFEAASYYESAYELSRNPSDLEHLGDVQWKNGRAKQALENFETLLEQRKQAFSSNPNPRNTASLIRAFRKKLNLVDAMGRSERFEASKRTVLDLIENLDGETRKEEKVQFEIGDLLISLGNHQIHRQQNLEEAEEYIEKAEQLPMLRGSNSRRETELRARVLRAKGSIEDFKGNLEEALRYLNDALELQEQLNNQRRTTEDHKLLGNIHKKTGDFDAALSHYKSALEIAEATGHRKDVARIFSDLGSLYKNMENLDKAEEHHRRALEVAREGGLRTIEGTVSYNLGVTLIIQGRPEEGLAHLRTSLEISEETGDQYGIWVSACSIGIHLFRMDKQEEALTYLQKARNLAEDTENPVSDYHVHLSLSNVMMARGETAEALSAVETALSAARRMEARIGNEGEATALSRKGQIHRLEGNIETALELHGRALKLARNHEAEDSDRAEIRNQLALDHIEKGNREKARTHLGFAEKHLLESQSLQKQVIARITRLKYQIAFDADAGARQEADQLLQELEEQKFYLSARRFREWLEGQKKE